MIRRNLDKRRDGILIQEQVVDRPASGLSFGIWDAELSFDEQPSSRSFGVELIASHEPRVLGQKTLENILGVIGRLAQLDETIVLNQKNPCRHR
jgi:hypothetical protein